MRSLQHKPNVQPSDTDFPYGRIKDNTGANDGTPVNELVYGDFHQFFSKLMDDAGISPNELPECDYSGFQLNQALQNLINFPETLWNQVGVAGQPSFQNSWNYDTNPLVFKINKAKMVIFAGDVSGGVNSTTIFTLPVDYRPVSYKYFPVYCGGTNLGLITIDTAGNVSLDLYNNSGAAIFLSPISFPLDR